MTLDDSTFRSLFALSPGLAIVLDRDYRIVAVTDAYLKATRRTRDIVGQMLFDVFPDNPAEAEVRSSQSVRAHLDEVFATGQPHRMPEQRYDVMNPETGKFEERHWMLSAEPAPSTDGKVALAIHSVEDVTLARRYLARAETARSNLVQFVENAPAYLCILEGPKHRFALANPAYVRLFLQGKDFIGKPLEEVLPGAREQGFVALLDGVYRTGESAVGTEAEFEFPTSSGVTEKRYFNFAYQPTRAISGRIDGVAAYITDVTALVESRKKLALTLANEQSARLEVEAASRAKDEFLAVVSHELRTPLTSVIGWVQLLRTGNLPPARQEKALETVERNAKAQAALIEDLLDVSRIITGKIRLEVGHVNAADVVHSALESAQPAADAKGIKLRSVVDSALWLRGDPVRLQQVVWNLVANAIKFTPKGGHVDVAVARVDSSVHITVVDDGRGIPQDFVAKLFEPFRQLEGGTTRSYGGLGLGLAIVKHLTELHGGSVEVRSEGEGLGASFTVRLPVAALSPVRAPVLTEDPSEDVSDIAGLSVLVVDDEADTRDWLQVFLEKYGAKVRAVNSSAAGLEALREASVDVIISDVGMPDEDGYAFIARVRKLGTSEGGGTPAVALTAYSRPEDRSRALRAGFNLHVAKPIDPTELLVVLQSVVQRRRT